MNPVTAAVQFFDSCPQRVIQFCPAPEQRDPDTMPVDQALTKFHPNAPRAAGNEIDGLAHGGFVPPRRDRLSGTRFISGGRSYGDAMHRLSWRFPGRDGALRRPLAWTRTFIVPPRTAQRAVPTQMHRLERADF